MERRSGLGGTIRNVFEAIRYAVTKKSYDIEFSDEFDKLLGDLARRKGTIKGEIIKNALASYACLHRELKTGPDGRERKLSITNQRDEVLRDVILP